VRIELIYDRDCPNVERARANLKMALVLAGCDERWVEWDRGDAASPAYVRRHGSPTLLLDGADVGGMAEGCGGAACRVYRGGEGDLVGAPPVERIARALRAGHAAVRQRRRT
jgi:mercuric ion transport protein